MRMSCACVCAAAVVTYLAMGDAVGAEAGYYDFMEARGSSSSRINSGLFYSLPMCFGLPYN